MDPSHNFCMIRAIFNTNILLMVVACMSGCGSSSPDQISSATSQYQVANESAQSPESPNTERDPTTDPSRGRTAADSSFEIAERERIEADSGDRASSSLNSTSGQNPQSSRDRSAAGASPEELLEQIGRIEQLVERGEIPGSTQQQQDATFGRMMTFRRAAAEEVLAQQAEPQQYVMAKLAKLDSINALVAIGAENAMPDFLSYSEELIGDDNEDVRLAGTKGKLEALRMLAGAGDQRARKDFDEYFAQCDASDNEKIRVAGIVARIDLLMQLTGVGDQRTSNELGEYLDGLVDSENEEVRFTAINSKLAISSQLIKADLPGARDEVEQFAGSLMDDSNAEIAEMARLTLFNLQMQDVDSGQQQDPASVIEALRELFETSPKTPTLFQSTQVAIGVLRQRGYQAESKQALQIIADAFKNSENQQLASAVDYLMLQAGLMDFYTQVNDVLDGEGNPESLVTSAGDMLASDSNANKLAFIVAENVVRAAQNLEYSGQVSVAKQLYDLIQVTYADHEDKQLSEAARQMIEKPLARIGMIGKPIELTGALSTGQPFDWDSYRGKVVLIDFWATFCQPCIEEIPNIRKNYEDFRELGFEVVGINIDRERDTAKQFIESEQIPWANIVCDEAGSNPNAERYDVDSIPFVVLVGRDGNVAALHVRGSNLGHQIEKLLAQPEDKSDTTGSSPSG